MKKSEIIKRLSAIEEHLGIHKEQPFDKFAELKEAHRNGAVIQCKPKCTMNYSCWVDEHNPKWNPKFEYRIKPEEEEPKVGDVCKFWDNEENKYVVSVLTKIKEGDNYPYNTNFDSFKHAKPLTKQEVIELLFK